MASTTIVIPGREDLVLSNMTMSVEDVRASFAGDVDLSGYQHSEQRDGDDVTITFSARTGTKGAGDINVTIEGDVTINSTRIVIPGREDQVIPGVALSEADVRAAFAGSVNLESYEASTQVDDFEQVVTFSTRTGTKGQQDIMALIASAIAQNAAAATVAEVEEEEEEFEEEFFEEEEELANTLIVIPGREDQVIRGMVMDASMVKASFANTIDLSGYDVEEVENGDTLEVRFTARTGTKG